MAPKVRCAVLGLGRLGIKHAETIAHRVDGAELQTVCDPTGSIAEDAARRLGAARWTPDWTEVLHDPSIDAIVVTTPTTTHAEIVVAAAAAGKAIFVEKPLTGSLAEAELVTRALEEHKAFCQVGFMRRFDPDYAEAHRRIKAGDIGRPIYFKAVARDPYSPPPEFIGRSGGMFIDMAVHDFDLARFLIGSEVTSVAAHGAVLVNEFMRALGDVDQALAFIKFASGAAGDVEASRNAYYGYDVRAEIIGTEGTLQVGSVQQRQLQILTPAGRTHAIFPMFPERFTDAFTNELQAFVNCVRRQEPSPVTAADANKALEIAVAAQRSLETGHEVKVGHERS